MAWVAEVNQRLMTRTKSKKGTVIEVDNRWGRMKVEWDDGVAKWYSSLDPSITFIKLPDKTVSKADNRLAMENAGITDSWRDYD